MKFILFKAIIIIIIIIIQAFNTRYWMTLKYTYGLQVVDVFHPRGWL